MAALVCDICGGKLSVGTGGIAICDSCGMEHTKDRMQEKILEIKGIVKIDETDKVDNWYKMAEAAYENNNYDEAYNYYCKVLEVRVIDWVSTYRKGFCIGWKSTLANIRSSEVLGGIVDAKIQLIENESIEDTYKANGMMFIAAELMNWINSLNRLITNHANEYCESLESAVYEFYVWEQLISKMLDFNLAMFDEWTVKNVEDIVQIEGVLDAVINSSNNVADNLNQSFRVKNGSEYVEYYGKYIDNYKTIYPTSEARKASIQLASKINDVKYYFSKWKREKENQVKEERLAKFRDDNPNAFTEYIKNNEELREMKNVLKIANSEIDQIKINQRNILDKHNETIKEIIRNEEEIVKLRKKIFGKNKANEEAIDIERKIVELREALQKLENTNNILEDDFSNQKKGIEQKEKQIASTQKIIHELASEYGLD